MLGFAGSALLLCDECKHDVDAHADGGCTAATCRCRRPRGSLVDFAYSAARAEHAREWQHAAKASRRER